MAYPSDRGQRSYINDGGGGSRSNSSAGVIPSSAGYSETIWGAASQFSRNAHIPYINIKFGTISLTWRGDEDRPDYFISLSHTRHVSKASTMKISISFVPHYGEDPNRIEVEMIHSSGICLVSYGDLASGSKVRVYKAMVNTYSVTMDDGYLTYDLDLVSAAVSYNLVKYTHQPIDMSVDKDKGSCVENLARVLEDAASLMSEHYEFVDPRPVLTGHMQDYPKLDFGNESLPPLKFIMKAINQITCINDKEYFAVSVDDSYSGVSKGKIRVIRINTEAVNVHKTFEWGTRDGTVLSWSPKYDGSKALAASRDQMTKTVSTGSGKLPSIQEINPGMFDENGSQIKQGPLQDINKFLEGLKSQSKTVSVITAVNPDTGEQVSADISDSMRSDYTSADDYLFVNSTISDTQSFLKLADWAYTASLTVLGEDDDYQVGASIIRVTPVVAGKAHHSEGLYIVNETIDQVNGSTGFTTTYNLQRRTGDMSQGIYATKNTSDSKRVWVAGAFINYENYDPNEET